MKSDTEMIKTLNSFIKNTSFISPKFLTANERLLKRFQHLLKENEELKKDFVPLDFDPLECYSCGEPIKKDKKNRPECYCKDCEPMDREDLKQQNSQLKEAIRGILDIDKYLETGTVEGWAEDTRKKIKTLKAMLKEDK